jgi:hypothetical protein
MCKVIEVMYLEPQEHEYLFVSSINLLWCIHPFFSKANLIANEPLSLTHHKKRILRLWTLSQVEVCTSKLEELYKHLSPTVTRYEVSTLGCEIKCEAIGYMLGNKGNLGNPSPFKGKR